MFDQLQLHLWFNHIPIIGTAIGVLIALGGLLLKSDAIRKTGLVIYVVTGLAVFPANFTGEGAEDIVEDKVSWVNDNQIHEHEELAETAMTLTVIGLVLALLVLFQFPRQASLQRLITAAYLMVGLAGCVVIGLAGHEGGKIMRPHLGAATSGAANSEQGAANPGTVGPEQNEADDD